MASSTLLGLNSRGSLPFLNGTEGEPGHIQSLGAAARPPPTACSERFHPGCRSASGMEPAMALRLFRCRCWCPLRALAGRWHQVLRPLLAVRIAARIGVCGGAANYGGGSAPFLCRLLCRRARLGERGSRDQQCAGDQSGEQFLSLHRNLQWKVTWWSRPEVLGLHPGKWCGSAGWQWPQAVGLLSRVRNLSESPLTGDLAVVWYDVRNVRQLASNVRLTGTTCAAAGVRISSGHRAGPRALKSRSTRH